MTNLLRLSALTLVLSLCIFATALASRPCLTFLDQDQPADNFDVLTRKFQAAQKESLALPVQDNQYELQLQLMGQGNLKDAVLNTVKTIIHTPVYDPILYNGDVRKATMQKSFDLRQTQIAQEQSFPSTAFERFIFARHANPNRTTGEDIVLATQWIDYTVNAEGKAPVLFLGRTPCFVQLAYEELRKKSNPALNLDQSILHLSFSGTPDALSLRAGSDYGDDQYKIVRNMLTPEKLAFYENYMSQKGLGQVGQKLYVVDMMGSGSSLNSFLRIMRHYYESHLKRDMPDVHFICLSLPFGSDHEEPFRKAWKFLHQTRKLTFKSLPEFGLRPLEIKLTPLQVSAGTLTMLLDHDPTQYFMTHGIEFPAQKWRPEFQEHLSQGGKFHKEAYEMLRPIFQQIIKTHEVLFGREVDKDVL
jgi:hypothetical protein